MNDQTLRPLDRSSSWRRLATINVGRLATSLGALPIVVPVNYVICDDALVFAIEPDSALARAIDGGVFAFETSGHDTSSQWWWSVIVRGRASLVDPSHHAHFDLEQLRLSSVVTPAVGTAHLVQGAEVRSTLELPSLATFLTGPGHGRALT